MVVSTSRRNLEGIWKKRCCVLRIGMRLEHTEISVVIVVASGRKLGINLHPEWRFAFSASCASTASDARDADLYFC